jgi:hypothetical protein
MKSMLFMSLSALFMAAAAKPFIGMPKSDSPHAWSAYRSYPYARWADAAVQEKKWGPALQFYAQALQRDPANTRLARGIQMCWHHLMQQLPENSQAAPQDRHLLPRQFVRFDIPRRASERRQQTLWRGPIVALTASSPVVAFETAKKPASEMTAPLFATHMRAVAVPLPPPALPVPSNMPEPVALAYGSRWSFNSSSTVRSRDLPALARSIGEFGGSQSGAEVRWRLAAGTARPLHLAASAFVGTNTRRGFDPGSTQAVVGFRYKPLEHANVVLGADRLIRVGTQSRNAFALRAMGDAGQNYDGPADAASWLHWHAGFDTALIGVKSRDLFASSEARAGMGFRLTDTVSVTPHIGMNGILQQAGNTQTLVEAGPGVWLRWRINDTSRLDMRVAYRFNIAGSAPTRDGVVAQVAVGF